MSQERRWLATPEVRASDDGKTLFGRCVVYDEWSKLLYRYFKERIARGAFDASLASDRDVYATMEHDRERYLGRLSAGTLKLASDERGITVELPVPEYSYAQDLVVAVRRGDLKGMSFIFDVVSDDWETIERVPCRTVRKADLYEVSFVYDPCYPTTEAGIRMAFPATGEERAVEIAKELMAGEARSRHLNLLEVS